jgi:hypothetical protein
MTVLIFLNTTGVIWEYRTAWCCAGLLMTSIVQVLLEALLLLTATNAATPVSSALAEITTGLC